jgi:cell division protein FtsB
MTPGGSDPADDAALFELHAVVSVFAAQVATFQSAVDRLTGENATLKAENVTLKDEIARLKGLPPRPKFKPLGLEQATSRPAPTEGRKRRHQISRPKY